MNVVFEDEPIIYSAQVLIPIVVQETTPVIENNVPVIVNDI